MSNKLFSATRDQEVIKAGGFFCWACLVGKPLDDKSPDSRYCVGCYESLAAEAKLTQPGSEIKDSWTKDGAFFVHLGEKYGIVPDGQTVSLGPTARAHQAPPEPQKPVAKIPTKGIAPEHQQAVIMQHPGRPRKEGEVHRTTKWRREKQGILL